MKRLALVAALSIAALYASAYDFAGSGFTWDGSGSLSTGIQLVDDTGGSLSLTAEAEPAAAHVAALHSMVAEVRAWKSVAPAELRAVDSPASLQVTVIPQSFSFEGVDLKAALPAGLQLFYSGPVEYDFKIKTGKYMVRVRGVYTSEEDMAQAALGAYKDPVNFIATRDPQYVQRRLEELADQAEQLDTIAKGLDGRIADLEKATFASSGDAKQERTTKAEQDIEALKAELVAYQEKEAARQAEADSRDAADKAKAEQAMLTALNGNKPVNPEGMARLMELKKADPSLDKKAAAEALKRAASAEKNNKLNLSSQEISAIYLVEFGEK
jgi:hypothetical protein